MIGLSAAAVSLALLIGLAGEVWFERSPNGLDRQVFQWLQSLRSASLDRFFLALTSLGNPTALLIVVVTGVGLLWVARRHLDALALVGGFGGTAFTVMVLKLVFGRERPVPIMALLSENSPAFPSAHAAMSVVVYLLCGYLVARQVRSMRKGMLAIIPALALTLGIGVSRLYLGAHWLTDVLGGYALGSIWLSLLIAHAEFRRVRVPVSVLNASQCQRLQWSLMICVPALLLLLVAYMLIWRM